MIFLDNSVKIKLSKAWRFTFYPNSFDYNYLHIISSNNKFLLYKAVYLTKKNTEKIIDNKFAYSVSILKEHYILN